MIKNVYLIKIHYNCMGPYAYKLQILKDLKRHARIYVRRKRGSMHCAFIFFLCKTFSMIFETETILKL